jgi:hypothetical protein
MIEMHRLASDAPSFYRSRLEVSTVEDQQARWLRRAFTIGAITQALGSSLTDAKGAAHSPRHDRLSTRQRV